MQPVRPLSALILTLAALAATAASPPSSPATPPTSSKMDAPASPPAYLDGWTTTGPRPEPPPSTGRFVHIDDREEQDVDEGVVPALVDYLRLPEGKPVDGRISVWSLVVMKVPKSIPAAYAYSAEIYDCTGRRARDGGMQLYSRDGQLLGWSDIGDWSPVADDGYFQDEVFKIVCEAGKPRDEVLPSLEATLADAQKRLAAMN